MSITRSRTLCSGNSEVIRLPKDVAFGDDVELILVRSGDVMTRYPAARTIPEMLARLAALPAVSMPDRRDEEETLSATAAEHGLPARHEHRDSAPRL